MASAGVTTDPEKKEAYYLRFHLLIMNEGKAVLKAKFDHAIPPNTLHTKLQEKKVLKTINYALKNNFLSQSQYRRLYPPNRLPSSEDFDVSLLVYLLRNICGMKSQSPWWSQNENKNILDTVVDEEADIVRIRNMRNQMNHKQVASLEPNEFEELWDLAEQVMVRLAAKCNIPDQKLRIDELKARQLDLVTDEMRSIRSNTEVFLHDFLDEAHFVKTAAYERSKTLLQNKNILILTGHPGEGKTTVAARLALEKSKPRNCLKLAGPSDWRKIDLNLKLFDTVIIDDIFGAGALDQKLLGEWGRYLPEIERAAKAKKVRVIITSRHYIYEESKEELGSLPLFSDKDATLLLTSCDLTDTERSDILKMQATKNEKDIPQDILTKCVEASKGPTEEKDDFLFGFPECASMFVRSENMLRTGAEFFKKPASFFKKYLEDLYRGKEKDKFLALVAVWAKENKRISQSELRKVRTASNDVKRIVEVFDRRLDGDFLETMRVSLDAHVGGYLVFTEATGEYAFSHNVIGDMVGLVIGQKKLEQALELCPRDFLMNYVSLGDAGHVDFKLVIQERQFGSLAEKFANMLLRKNCNSGEECQPENEFQKLQRRGERSNNINIINTLDFGIIKHSAFNSEKFVKKFIEYVEQTDIVKDIFGAPVMEMRGYFFDYGISMEHFDMCLLGYAWYSGLTVFAKEVIIRKILGTDHYDHSVSLLLATHSRQIESVKFLLANGAKVTGDVIYIAMHKSIEILRRLLQQPGTDVNDRGNAINGNYPLIIAARKGFTEAVQCMIEFQADTSVQNRARMTPLHKAIIYGHSGIVTSLIEAGAPLNVKGGKFKRTPMHLAVDLGKEDLVEYLLRKGASLRVKDHRGHYPIHIAAIHGHVHIVKKLLAADKTQEAVRISSYGKKSVIKGMSLFHIAVWKKNSALLDALIALDADPNIQDFYGQTPLFLAIMKGNEELISKLLAYERTDRVKAQKQSYTPLHAAVHQNNVSVAKVLAQHSDVNARDKYGKTAFHVACEKANIELISYFLMQNRADPKIITKRGDTVFHILRRCKKKVPGSENKAKLAEQMITELCPDFAEQLPNLKNKAGIIIFPRKHVQQNRNAMISPNADEAFSNDFDDLGIYDDHLDMYDDADNDYGDDCYDYDYGDDCYDYGDDYDDFL